MMKRKNGVFDLFEGGKNIETVFDVSRDIFFDLYLGDILKLAAVVYAGGTEKSKLSSTGKADLAAVNKCVVSLIKRMERMVRAKVAQEYLDSLKTAEKAKTVLIKRFGLSEETAVNKIRKESLKSCESIRDFSDTVILAENFGKTQKINRNRPRRFS